MARGSAVVAMLGLVGCTAVAATPAGTWNLAGQVPTSASPTLLVLDGGGVFASGGMEEMSVSTATALWSPASSSWTRSASMSWGRVGHAAVALTDGSILIVGGCRGTDCDYTDEAELLDPKRGASTPVGSLDHGRLGHSATRLSDGRVLVVGGSNLDRIQSSFEIYDPRKRTWHAFGFPLATPRTGHHAVLLPDGRVLVAGGSSKLGDVRSAEIWDPRAARLEWHPAGELSSAPVLLRVFAGVVRAWTSAGTIEEWNEKTRAWQIVARLPRKPNAAAEAFLADGRLLAVRTGASEAWVGDPRSGSWADAGPLPAAAKGLEDLRIAALPDGGALLVGHAWEEAPESAPTSRVESIRWQPARK